MKDMPFKRILGVALASAAVCASAQSSFQDFVDTASATADAIRENHERNEAETDIRAIFAKAKEAEEDGNVDFCGFYVGMSRADARALASHYALKYGESSLSGDPVYSIHFSLKGVRRITKGGNSYEELCRAVANRVGDLQDKRNWKGADREEWYEYKTIDGVRVTMAESRLPNAKIDAGFNLVDTTGNIRKESECKAAEDGEGGRASQLGSNPIIKAATEDILASMVDIPGKDFKMGKTEVTQAQWEAIMGDNPSQFIGENDPVGNVSWDDCQEFLSLLNSIPVVKNRGLTFRLPSEDEWTFACRAGASGKYCKLASGTEIEEGTLGLVAWFENNSNKQPHPVGQKQPNAFGLYDMCGNISEWCQDEMGSVSHYAKGQHYEHHRVEHGGSWYVSARDCESSDQGRGWDPPSNRYFCRGFRLCAEIVSD